MKKIIALFVIMLAFSLNANAQQKQAPKQQAPKSEAVVKAAAKDLELLSTTVDLTEEQKGIYKRLFETKHQNLTAQNLPAERKEVLATSIESKIKSVMTPDQIAKLDSNPELLKTLTH